MEELKKEGGSLSLPLSLSGLSPLSLFLSFSLSLYTYSLCHLSLDEAVIFLSSLDGIDGFRDVAGVFYIDTIVEKERGVLWQMDMEGVRLYTEHGLFSRSAPMLKAHKDRHAATATTVSRASCFNAWKIPYIHPVYLLLAYL
ncbi:uncharacterized protein BO97DRAFT_417054 [Aspergillus homomorphus CBS 101889]|uniref:Uncharacterized protein n=1 Tax=Aspergillus homomorphus (strain CBS 101889) TaxID=1450537 RepID=A0A395HNG2_ASPHC|nr:hypothetical protein BO97DRAFT_417054 [Aspergillus homomorphus CBS 101889]RAL09156.1 hypothetical protein BO97DRAFT_417054 [Aspergillus homomorphus CBS 101889]